jgi:predicted oxidoreductase
LKLYFEKLTTLKPIKTPWLGRTYKTTENESMIQICLENKITTFDHADIYGSDRK